jgi:hypothetical protein
MQAIDDLDYDTTPLAVHNIAPQSYLEAAGYAEKGLWDDITNAAEIYTQQMKEQESSFQDVVEFFDEVIWRMKERNGDLTQSMAAVINTIHQFQLLPPGKVFFETKYHDSWGDFHTVGFTTLQQIYQIGKRSNAAWTPDKKTKDKWTSLCNIPNEAKYRDFDHFMRYDHLNV